MSSDNAIFFEVYFFDVEWFKFKLIIFLIALKDSVCFFLLYFIAQTQNHIKSFSDS